MATRSKRFASGVVTSYGAILVNILYTLASVPLALHYLDKEEFGLWALGTCSPGLRLHGPSRIRHVLYDQKISWLWDKYKLSQLVVTYE